MPELAEVRILGLPVDVYQRVAEHHDELMREFALIATDSTDDRTAVPARLLSLVGELRARFSNFTARPRADLDDAVARGVATIDLVYSVPPEAAAAASELDQLLDEADAFCRSGDLLTLTTPPESVALRRWLLGEFVRQVSGEPPTPWPGDGAGARGRG